MKRFHVHVGVTDLERAIQFYTTLFGQAPSKKKPDYAKWMLEDPRINFAISNRTGNEGVDHLGIQVEREEELSELTKRLKNADLGVFGEGESTCCYSNSNKAWVKDPSGIAWETYQTMGDAEIYSKKTEDLKSSSCGSTGTKTACC